VDKKNAPIIPDKVPRGMEVSIYKYIDARDFLQEIRLVKTF